MTHAPSRLRLLNSSSTARGAEQVIVVGLDGSPTSWDAFVWAAQEVTRTGGRLIAVYVAPTVEPGAEFGAPINYGAAEEARDEMVAQLKGEAERRARDLGVRVRFVREIGDSADALTTSHDRRTPISSWSESPPRFCTTWPAHSVKGSCPVMMRRRSLWCPSRAHDRHQLGKASQRPSSDRRASLHNCA